jgi:tetratricopeptide (TPR) repeat protein
MWQSNGLERAYNSRAVELFETSAADMKISLMNFESNASISVDLSLSCLLVASAQIFCTYSPVIAQTAYERGVTLLDRHKAAKAIPYFTQSIVENEKCVDCYMQRGLAYKAIGDYAKAELDFKTVFKMKPTYADAHRALAESFHKRGNLSEALKEYSEAIRLDSKHGAFYYYRGLVREDQNDHKGAIADFSCAIKLQSTKDRFYKSRALSYSKNKEYDKAIADYTKCLEMNPNVLNAMLSRAECYVDAHRYEEALTKYTEIIALNPHDARGYVARANVYKKLGKTDLADKDLKSATAEGENFSF